MVAGERPSGKSRVYGLALPGLTFAGEEAELDIEALLEAADQGDDEAMFALGVAYDFGEGVEQDHAKAVEWYLQASELGNIDAMYNLAVSYQIGEGVEADTEEAFDWFLKAAEGGHPDAMGIVARAYSNGDPVEQDDEKAAEWLAKGAETGDPDQEPDPLRTPAARPRLRQYRRDRGGCRCSWSGGCRCGA